MKANNPHKKAKKRRIFYVCRDLERATGLEQNWPNYFIITNPSGFARQMAKKDKRIILISDKPPHPNKREVFSSRREKNKHSPSSSQTGLFGCGGEKILDTRELLAHPQTVKKISKGDYIVVFKNTAQIEEICRQKKWQLLNPPAELAAKVEEKISQVKWLGNLKKFLPLIKITKVKNIAWNGKKFILQYNRSHTGSGTILVSSARQLAEIKKQFPEREARLSRFIDGPMFTNNNIVWNKKIMTGNINYQITGLKPFTGNPFATVGNDWALPHEILTEKQFRQYEKIAVAVGKKLARNGWRGLYGIDTALETKTGRLYLIEINARQPASTTYESQLQQKERWTIKSLTTFEAHLSALLNFSSTDFKLIKIKDGAQIIQRVTAGIPHLPKLKKKPDFSPHTKKTLALKTKMNGCLFGVGVNFIQYENNKIDSDLLRLQSEHGIMAGHKKLNQNGLRLIKFIKLLKLRRD